MKKILLVLTLILTTFFFSMGQGKLTNKPTDGTLDATDLFWSVHGGTTDKKMYGITLMDYSHNTADSVRFELEDSIAQVRSEIMGSEGFSKTGNYIYLTNPTDSIGIGTNMPMYKLDILGDQRTTGSIYITGILRFANSDAMVYNSGYDLMFYDEMYGSAVSLSGLMTLAGSKTIGVSGLTSGGVAPNYNMRLGGTLNQSTSISLNNYLFNLYRSDTEDYFLIGGGTTILAGEDHLQFYSPTKVSIKSDKEGSVGSIVIDTTLNASSNGHSFNMGTEEFNITGNTDKNINLKTTGAGSVKVNTEFHVRDTSIITLIKKHGGGIAAGNQGSIQLNDEGEFGYDADFKYSNDSLYAPFFRLSGSSGFFMKDLGSNSMLLGTPYYNLPIRELYGGFYGIGIDGLGSLRFANYGSEIISSFQNDSTRNAADTSWVWSANAIREYVGANAGTGEVHISGTPSAGQIPIFTGANTIEGDSVIIFKSDGTIADDQDTLEIRGNINWTVGGAGNEIDWKYLMVHKQHLISTMFDGVSLQVQYGDDENTYHNFTGRVGINNGLNIYKSGSYNMYTGATNPIKITEYSTDDTLYLMDNYGNVRIGGSLRADGISNFKDSTYLNYLAPGGMPSTGTFATISPTRALDTATINLSGEPITYKEYLPDFKTYYNDTEKIGKYDERNWITGFDTNKMEFTWTRTLPPTMKAFEILQRGIEQRDEYINELYEQNESQQIRIEKLEKENAYYKTRIEAIEKKLGL